ncbi:MAG: heavy metal translocating P-type ATPase [Lysobacteraceae bacterium]
MNAARCRHCGEPLDAAAVTDAQGAPSWCCHGCASAANFIESSGLGDYYRLRQSEAVRPQQGDEDFSLWDRADLLAEHSRQTPEGREITVLTDAMRCAACAWLIDRALRRREGVSEVIANAVTGRIRIVWDQARAPLSGLLQDLSRLGYRPQLAPGQAREQARKRERRTAMIRLGVAGLGAMQAMMYAEALYLDTSNQMSIPTRDFMRQIAFLVSTPVVFYAGWPFIEGMIREVRQRRFGMDTLVATSVLLAYGASLVETLRGGAQVWFDAAVMFVLFLLVARQIEAAARRRAVEHVETLSQARPMFARRETGTDAQAVPVAALQAGDVVRIAPGEAAPADGIALESCAFDEALLSGEATPQRKQVGDAVLAGSLAMGANARIKVERVGQDTRLSHLVRLIERAQEDRPAAAKLADAVAARFVAILFGAAALTAVWWWHHEPARAFEIALAVLVVACPCALSLALPTALASAHAALAKLGVLALKPDALTTLAKADAAVFDKTGTLTRGMPVLHDVEVFDGCTNEMALARAAWLERDSRHPLAEAFRSSASQWPAAQVAQVPGEGVEALNDGVLWRLGRAGFAVANERDDGALWLSENGIAKARFMLADPLREDAGEAIAAIGTLGLSCELLSGDGETAVREVAQALHIEHATARCKPEDKLARIRTLQAQGNVVLMLGDGVNDAPTLAGANVSIAMQTGAALAHGAADFVLMGGALARVPQAIALARRTRRIVRQNLGWALGYNLLAIPFAAMGWVQPWLAALGMAASSLAVTLNALRLLRSPSSSREAATSARVGFA